MAEKLQILSPAGSVEQLIAAVNNGCDAVYLGLDIFNARMKAPNFNADNLPQWIDYCHLFGVKVYVAINTSIKNDEFTLAVKLLSQVYLNNADGVIVTDLTLMRIAGQLPKPFEVVASTQLNVHDRYGAEFVKKCGATTVVCSRECSFDQIRDIASTGIKVESFLHGAMCVCQSGQCLFSSMVGGNSGNRGLCAQPCRKYYFAEGNANAKGYLLSAHDISSFRTVRQLADSGVTTFKIEGRNRRPEYAGLASKIYRKLIDNDFIADAKDEILLAEMFNRATSDNKYLNGDNSDVIFTSAQNHTGVPVGVIKDGKIQPTCELRKGDGLKVFNGNKEVCGGVVLDVSNDIVHAQFSAKVSDGMLVNRTTSVNLCEDVLTEKRRLNVSLEFIAKAESCPTIIAKYLNVVASVTGDFVIPKAQNKPTSRDEISAQLRKTGGTYYTICDIALDIDDIFIPKSQLNALRREVLDVLSKNIVDEYNAQFSSRNSADLSVDAQLAALYANSTEYNVSKVGNESAIAVLCYDESQLSQAFDSADYLIYKPNTINIDACKIASKFNAYIDLPSFADMQFVSNILLNESVGIVCNNVGHIELARELNLNYIAGAGCNIFNDHMVKIFNDAQTYTYSRELTLKEVSLFANKHGVVFVDGKIPLMQLCHCPYKVAFKCDCSNCKAHDPLVYRDELNNRFEIIRRKAGCCVFELFNFNKLSVVNKLKTSGRYLIDFDEKVLQHYTALNNGLIDDYCEEQPYTKARLYDTIN